MANYSNSPAGVAQRRNPAGVLAGVLTPTQPKMRITPLIDSSSPLKRSSSPMTPSPAQKLRRTEATPGSTSPLQKEDLVHASGADLTVRDALEQENVGLSEKQFAELSYLQQQLPQQPKVKAPQQEPHWAGSSTVKASPSSTLQHAPNASSVPNTTDYMTTPYLHPPTPGVAAMNYPRDFSASFANSENAGNTQHPYAQAAALGTKTEAVGGVEPPQYPYAIAAQGYGMPAVPPNGQNLAQVIQSTKNWDLEKGVDQNGNPLPSRLFGLLEENERIGVSEAELDALLQNIQPEFDVAERNWKNTPAGLKNALYPHQEIALSWMKKLEQGSNKGGILADDMGLGKTISTLALLLERPGPVGKRTNLIVTPLSLLEQWKEEVCKKVKVSHRMSVFVYHDTKTTADELIKYDVVLTTYGIVASESRRYQAFLEENKGRKIDYNSPSMTSKFPLLHPTKAKFHRIVLDEAQCIKNTKTKTAEACFQLQATHRWCLTGTPMMNTIKELFSLVHFLRIRPYCHWSNFRQAFGKLFGVKSQTVESRKMGMDSLRALLKAIMLRRLKSSKLNGQPILQLPVKTVHTVFATLTKRDRKIYDEIEEASKKKLENILKEKTLHKHYVSVLVMLLRMRFACCHSRLNVRLEEAEAQLTNEMKMYARGLDARVVERIKANDGFQCPVCLEAVESPSFFTPCGHWTCNACCGSIVEDATKKNLQNGEESTETRCPVCTQFFDHEKCFSLEAFQDVHMPEVAALRKDDESDEEDEDEDEDVDDVLGHDATADAEGAGTDAVAEDAHVSASSKDKFTLPEIPKLSSLILHTDREDASHNEGQDGGNDSKEDNKTKIKSGKNSNKPPYSAATLRRLRVNATRSHDKHRRYMNYLSETYIPSAKVRKCVQLLKALEERGEKTIVFSQWTLFLDLIQVAMRKAGLAAEPERYDGTMTSDERARAVYEFRYRRTVKVMLVSLRAGNTGLNLTAASNVIIMDPFWNPYVEMQAVDRAHRIGQMQPVNVYRILARKTLEGRIVELQERKKQIIEAALDENESRKIGRLNIGELKFLFNLGN